MNLKYLTTSTIASLLFIATTAHSSVVTYNFEGEYDLSYYSLGDSIPFTASFSYNSDLAVDSAGACRFGTCQYYPEYNWAFSIDGFLDVKAVNGSSEVNVYNNDDYYSDGITAESDLINQQVVDGVVFKSVIFEAYDYDSLMFDSSLLPTSMDDFVGMDNVSFRILLGSDDPDSILRYSLPTKLTSFTVSAVPVPPAVLLLSSGLLFLAGFRRTIRSNN